MIMCLLSSIETRQVHCILQGDFLLVKVKSTSLHVKNYDKYVYMNIQMLVYLKVAQQVNIIIFFKHTI